MNNNIKEKLIRLSISLTVLANLTACGIKKNNESSINKSTPKVTIEESKKKDSPIPSKEPTNTILETITPTYTPTPTETPIPTCTPTETPIPTSTPTYMPIQTEIPTPKENNTIDISEQLKYEFKKEIEDIKEFAKSDNTKHALEKGKECFINIVDFMFYGKDINGYTFSMFKDDFKEDMYSYLKDLDSVLMYIKSDYKESIGKKYNIVKDFSKEKYSSALNYIISKIGQDKYNDIISKKDSIWGTIKEKTSDLKNKSLALIDGKYKEWKNKESE